MKPVDHTELETLREEARQLREVLHASEQMYYRGLHFTRSERFVLGTMIASIGISSMARLTSDRDRSREALRVTIHKLRKKLGTLDPPLRILGLYGQGYYMTNDDKARLAALAVTVKETT